jgi:hypothetical protein
MKREHQVTEQRPLTLEEQTLLRWLLAHGLEGAELYLDQIPRARVVSRCSCGCPSVDLALDGRLSKRVGGSTILADVQGRSPEGALVGVIVHARDGELSELEVYSRDGLAARFSLPTPGLLELVQS